MRLGALRDPRRLLEEQQERERPTQRLDAWIEEIPYDETRRYTRRVVQSWGIYAWLDRGELPALRPTLPRR